MSGLFQGINRIGCTACRIGSLRGCQLLFQFADARLACRLVFCLLLLQGGKGLVDFFHAGIDFLLNRCTMVFIHLALRFAQLRQFTGDVVQFLYQFLLAACGLLPFVGELLFQLHLLALCFQDDGRVLPHFL